MSWCFCCIEALLSKKKIFKRRKREREREREGKREERE
jgi:hypothetical protein